MATIDWPAGRAFEPRRVTWGVSTPKAAWAAPYTGARQTLSHLADRLRCAVTLPPCNEAQAGLREAFFLSLASTGDWVRMGHPTRPLPLGTLRGTPTAAAAAAAGARTVQVQSVAGATLLGGDVLGGGGRLLLAAYPGAVANGAGVLTVPLVLPLQVALASGAAISWQAPTTTWQLLVDMLDLNYGRARWQGELTIPLAEV